MTCFAERGFAATRLDDVAKRAGVTKGTLYLYFPNKAELFKAVVRQAILPNLVRAEDVVRTAVEPAPVILAQLLNEWATRMTAPASSIPKIILAEAGNFPEIAQFYHDEVISRGRNAFRQVLQLGVERGEFRPMNIESTIDCIVAPMLLSMLWRHSFQSFSQKALDPEAICQALLEILAHGLAPTHAQPSDGAAQ